MRIDPIEVTFEIESSLILENMILRLENEQLRESLRRVDEKIQSVLTELREYEEMQGQLFDNPDFDECIGICDTEG